MSTISIRVNFDRLRERLSAEEGRPMTPFDVRSWLVGEGFQVGHGEWMAAPEHVPLRDEEIVDRVELRTEDGVTFATTHHYPQQAQ